MKSLLCEYVHSLSCRGQLSANSCTFKVKPDQEYLLIIVSVIASQAVPTDVPVY